MAVVVSAVPRYMMPMIPDLPPDLRAALDRLTEGVSRSAIAPLAEAQSRNYRAGGGSGTIKSSDDALAYAFTRLPATYAAAIAVFGAARAAMPDFRPHSMLDIGAGPGTAAFGAARAFETLEDFTLVDRNPALRDLAIGLLAQAEAPSLRSASYRLEDARAAIRPGAPGDVPRDLVVASYVAGEIASGDMAAFTDTLWAATAHVLAVIEPGTPAGYERVMQIRARLIAAGGLVAAPCPHERACPIVAPDWCHFAQRLPRSRDHLRVKGAAVPFEDEKFSYVVMTREAPQRIGARVLAPPDITKAAIATKLCTPAGLEVDIAARRDRAAYRGRKSWHWGDAVSLSGAARPGGGRDADA